MACSILVRMDGDDTDSSLPKSQITISYDDVFFCLNLHLPCRFPFVSPMLFLLLHLILPAFPTRSIIISSLQPPSNASRDPTCGSDYPLRPAALTILSDLSIRLIFNINLHENHQDSSIGCSSRNHFKRPVTRRYTHHSCKHYQKAGDDP